MKHKDRQYVNGGSINGIFYDDIHIINNIGSGLFSHSFYNLKIKLIVDVKKYVCSTEISKDRFSFLFLFFTE